MQKVKHKFSEEERQLRETVSKLLKREPWLASDFEDFMVNSVIARLEHLASHGIKVA